MKKPSCDDEHKWQANCAKTAPSRARTRRDCRQRGRVFGDESANRIPVHRRKRQSNKRLARQRIQQLHRSGGSVIANSFRIAFAIFLAVKGFDSPTQAYMFARAVPIPFSKKSRRNVVRQATDNSAENKRSTRVRLHSARGLAQAQFPHRGPDPVAFHQARRRSCPAAVSRKSAKAKSASPGSGTPRS